MPAILSSLTAVERLAAHASVLPPEFARALGEDLEYARFGAALPELPWFGGWAGGVQAWLGRGEAPRFARLFRERAPVAFGLKAAELVANGALVGTDAGLAFLAGHFTQLAVMRALEPMVQRLAVAHRTPKETVTAARGRIEWVQSLYLMQELHGSPLVGTSAIRTKLQIRKDSGPKGIGRGLYELIRVASNDAVGDAPSKLEVDGWMRGLYLFSLALGSPLGRLKGIDGTGGRELYRGPDVDVWAGLESALETTRRALGVLIGLIRRNSFTPRSRAKVLELLPEGPPDVPPPRPSVEVAP
ncbi:MAG: hypothetical protein JNK82_11845 [Myxococcaceae bacterium]|nr:hypothetical protein [Myxococcaceae bacterium]